MLQNCYKKKWKNNVKQTNGYKEEILEIKNTICIKREISNEQKEKTKIK